MSALSRLEEAASARPSPAELAAALSEAQGRQAAIERDCESLRAECDGLRRELAALQERHARLMETAGTVHDRLDRAIDGIDELLGA
ncbi:hypothetical protein SH611_07800 [Geminicoccaceae bacterium 1502E]|nr:hypothetical protein [Geminicoccaceae bacterium 1502E]